MLVNVAILNHLCSLAPAIGANILPTDFKNVGEGTT